MLNTEQEIRMRLMEHMLPSPSTLPKIRMETSAEQVAIWIQHGYWPQHGTPLDKMQEPNQPADVLSDSAAEFFKEIGVAPHEF